MIGITYRFYLCNTLYESGWLIPALLNQLVVASHHIHPGKSGSTDYTLRLTNTLSNWQFAQSYRWATPLHTDLLREALNSQPADL